jgi:hypothetical protein
MRLQGLRRRRRKAAPLVSAVGESMLASCALSGHRRRELGG